MAAGCCGVKKQKLNGSNVAAVCVNGFTPNGKRPVSSKPTTGAGKVVNRDMCIFCFDVLFSYLHCEEPPKNPKFPNDKFPLFVTWKIGKDRKLRGCIGTFNTASLHQGLREYAITSACKDSRFDPIGPDEFSRLHCSVSLLMDFEVAASYLDWEIGLHGIRIEFASEKGSKKAATYLPEVAVEQGWNQIQTIDSLLRKGGYKGHITPEVRCSVTLTRFMSDKMTVSYAEYLSHRSMPSAACVSHHNGLLNGFLCSSSSGESSTDRRRRASISPQRPPGHHYFTRQEERHRQDVHNPTLHASRYLPAPSHPYCPH